MIGNVLVASLLIGVARSWELVGDRDTGISASIAALVGHERHLGGSVAARPMSRVTMTRGPARGGLASPGGGSPAGGLGPAGGAAPPGDPARREAARGRPPRREARVATAARRAVPGRPPPRS